MSKKHEEILDRISPEAVRALINAQVSSFGRIELPDRTPIEVMDSLAGCGLVHGRFLTIRGEVVREYAVERALKDMEGGPIIEARRTEGWK